MRIRIFTLLSLTFFVCLFHLAAADYRLLYTGRLYGYFRYPEIQPDNLNACPVSETEGGPLGAINEELLKQFAADDTATTARLAVGDNFAPFILARQIRQGNHLKTKENFDPPVDNVACLMQLLHLDAVVPGRHDFYFGPERLRHLARILREPRGELRRSGGESTPYKPVRLLGANLTLRTRPVDPKQPFVNIDHIIPARQPQDADSPVVTLPPVVLPWMRTVRIGNAFRLKVNGETLTLDLARSRLKTAYFSKTEAEKFNAQFKAEDVGIALTDESGAKYEFARTFRKVCIIRAPAEKAECKDPVVTLTPYIRTTHEEYRLSVDAEYSLEDGHPLVPDTSYLLVLTMPAGPKLDSAVFQGFRVEAAYFESPVTQAEKEKPGAYDVKPWVCVAGPGTGQEKVAVFGVVDPDMGEFIGRLNDTWLNVDKQSGVIDRRHETNLHVSDAAEAMQQVLDYYDEVGDCKGARKVLLAQMPQQKLADVIARLHVPFDVVIAQADADVATGEKNLSERFDSRVDDRTSVQPLVLVPGVHFYSEDPYGVIVRSQRLVVSNRATATLTGSVRQIGPSEFGLDRGPSFHHIPLDANGNDLAQFKDREVTIVGTPLLIGNASRGRIEGLTVSTVSPRTPESARLVTVERGFTNAVQLAPKVSPVNPFDALRRAGLVSKGDTVTEWLNRLPKDELDRLGAGKVAQPGAPEDVWKNFLEGLSLSVMQAQCHADVALLQHRDFFVTREFNDSMNSVGIYALVNAVLWKGDFIQCMNLPGATINSLMTRSRELQSAENRGLSTDLSRGWSLASLGAGTQSSDPQHRLLDGHWLDPKKLYSVAITDYLANGDTGYPTLQGAEPPPYVPLGRLRLHSLGGCLAAKLLAAKPNLDADEAKYVRDWCAESGNTLDQLVDRPKPPREPRKGFADWLVGWRQPNQVGKISSRLEKNAQWRPLWSVELFRAAASYSLFLHDGTEGLVTAKFPGITVVDLTAPQSAVITLDYFVRAQRDTGTWQLYGVSELNYGHRMQRGKPSGSTGLGETPYQVSLGANFWYHEAGFAARFLPSHRNPSGWKVQLPIGLRTQFQPQLLQIVPPSGTTSATVQPRAVRNFFVSFRPGLRYEYAFPRPPFRTEGPALRDTLDSFIEFGYQGGEIFHEPSEFRFANGTCFADGLGACLSRSPIASPGDILNAVVSRRNLFQEGAYVNFRLDMPIPLYLGSELVLENRGDFFVNRRHDTEVDPKFIDDLKASLTLPIYRKIAVAPTLEIFFFQNKIHNAFYRSYATYVALNYSFDWRTGLSWKKVLGFANPVPALPALPTR